jgi:hypothetical protein
VYFLIVDQGVHPAFRDKCPAVIHLCQPYSLCPSGAGQTWRMTRGVECIPYHPLASGNDRVEFIITVTVKVSTSRVCSSRHQVRVGYTSSVARRASSRYLFSSILSAWHTQDATRVNAIRLLAVTEVARCINAVPVFHARTSDAGIAFT